MSKENKKKMGYKQYEKLLALAHQKSEILAERYKELQTYFMGYIEFNGHNIEFNNWMNEHLKKDLNKHQNTEEQVNEEV